MEIKMRKKRDTVTYDLIDKRKVVYKGTTNNPEKRGMEHEREGKRFTAMRITSRKMTEPGAKEKEAEALETYRRNHTSKNPKYNKNSCG